MSEAVDLFAWFAGGYDRGRPQPPAKLTELITGWAGIGPRDLTVVDLGAGTGLSSVIWAGKARHVILVDPAGPMLDVARHRIEALPGGTGTGFSYVEAPAEETGLGDGCADIVTASIAFHWFDPARAIPEAARLLRPGGVFAVFENAWPPAVHWEADAAFAAFAARTARIRDERGVGLRSIGKSEQYDLLVDSGRFRFVKEVAVSDVTTGDADDFIDAARGHPGAAALLADGVGEDELGLDEVRAAARRNLPGPRPWTWTYRVRLAVT